MSVDILCDLLFWIFALWLIDLDDATHCIQSNSWRWRRGDDSVRLGYNLLPLLT